MKPIFLTLSLLMFVGCATTPPSEEFALARTALEAAKEQDASRYAPTYFHQAEEAYRKGEIAYRDQEYAVAEESFVKARAFAELADNSARAQKFKSGESVP